MKSTTKKSSQIVTSAKPTTLNLQTRPFTPSQTDVTTTNETVENFPIEKQNTSSPNILEKLISTPTAEASPTTIHKKHLASFRSQSMPIQAKLNIGEPNDKYEQEADATAAKVVQQINASPQNQSVQRQDSMEEDELQMKPISTLQRDVMEEEEELQAKSISTLQRDVMEEEEELQVKSLVQRRENLGGGEASTDLESSIQSARGRGQSLDASLQAKMGQAMEADFSGVKVHTDSQADQLNQSIQAKAFTTGQDVFFRQGAYNPSSRGGQELIAHELTHVVQQNGSKIQGKFDRFLSNNISKNNQHNNQNRGNISLKRQSIQRELTGEDPLDTYDEGDKSLFYGITPFRAKTLARRDNDQKKNKYHTIDLYNKAIGINTVMTTGNCIYGIFLIREALNDTNPVQNWGNYFPSAAQEVRDNPELHLWIEKLVANKHSIGMYDLSDNTKVGIYGFRQRRGKKKLKQKDRLTKNIDPNGGMMGHSGSVKADQIYGWLANNYTYNQAKNITPGSPGMPNGKFYAIDNWIYLAFFRRTSKLGIDFATSSSANGGLDANVYFNNAAVVGYVKGVKEDAEAGGLARGNAVDQQKHKRAITTSEYRHINKLINSGRLNPNKVKNYDEF